MVESLAQDRASSPSAATTAAMQTPNVEALAQVFARYVATVPDGGQFVAVDVRADELRDVDRQRELGEMLCAAATRHDPLFDTAEMRRRVCASMAWIIIPPENRVQVLRATCRPPPVGTLVERKGDSEPTLWCVQSVSGAAARCVCLGTGVVQTLHGCDLVTTFALTDATGATEAAATESERQPSAADILRAGGMMWTPFDHEQVSAKADAVVLEAARAARAHMEEQRAAFTEALCVAWTQPA